MPEFYKARESPINQIKSVKVSLSIMLPLSAALSEHTCRNNYSVCSKNLICSEHRWFLTDHLSMKKLISRQPN